MHSFDPKILDEPQLEGEELSGRKAPLSRAQEGKEAPCRQRGEFQYLLPRNKAKLIVSRDLAADACGKLTARQPKGERRAPAQVSPFRHERPPSWKAGSP